MSNKSCVIYFRNKIENEDLILLFLEKYIENLIKNNIVNSVTWIKNKNIKFCFSLIERFKKKYSSIYFSLEEVKKNNNISLHKIINDNDIIVNNEKMKFNSKKYTLIYKNRFLEKMIENKSFINVNVINFINRLKELEII